MTPSVDSDAPETPAPVVAGIVNPAVAAVASAQGVNNTPAALAALAAQQSRLQCRMYENKYPEVESLAMVNVRQIAEMGAYVHLLEYNNIEGMILLSELSRRRIRSVQKLIRVGRNEVVVVLRVDKEKGYIDLSKRRVSAEDVAKCEERYNKSKAVHSIMRHVAEKLNLNLEDMYNSFGWPLYKKYEHAYDAFKLALTDPDAVFSSFDIDESIKKELLSNIRRRLTPQAIKIRADIECTCFGYEGIDAVKKALTAGEACSTADSPIKIRLVAPPLYVMIANAIEKNAGLATLDKAIAKIEETIKASQGNLVVKMKPRAVSDTDDAELAQLMAKMERENAEISEDEDEDEDEDGDDDNAGAVRAKSAAADDDEDDD